LEVCTGHGRQGQHGSELAWPPAQVRGETAFRVLFLLLRKALVLLYLTRIQQQSFECRIDSRSVRGIDGAGCAIAATGGCQGGREQRDRPPTGQRVAAVLRMEPSAWAPGPDRCHPSARRTSREEVMPHVQLPTADGPVPNANLSCRSSQPSNQGQRATATSWCLAPVREPTGTTSGSAAVKPSRSATGPSTGWPYREGTA
jgi:hypothetical protein